MLWCQLRCCIGFKFTAVWLQGWLSIRGYFRVILVMVNVFTSESILTMFRNSDFLHTLVDVRSNCVMLDH